MAIPPIAIGDIIQVQIRTQVENQTVLNVLHYRSLSNRDTVTYQEGLNDLIDGIAVDDVTSIIDPMLPLMGPNAEVIYVQAQRVYPARDIYVRRNINRSGEHADDCDATNVDAVIVKQSEKTGRGRSGVFHLGGLANTTYALGEMTADSMTLLAGLASSLKVRMAEIIPDTGFDPGMYNPDLGGVTGFTKVADCTPRKQLRVIRRRTVGVGE